MSYTFSKSEFPLLLTEDDNNCYVCFGDLYWWSYEKMFVKLIYKWWSIIQIHMTDITIV